ncbi:MAG: hypothetical protein AAFX06_31220 [Planctomycetota bacterium]
MAVLNKCDTTVLDDVIAAVYLVTPAGMGQRTLHPWHCPLMALSLECRTNVESCVLVSRFFLGKPKVSVLPPTIYGTMPSASFQFSFRVDAPECFRPYR